MRVTLKDIAERYGVTKMTISMALRNHPRIPEKRRKEIKQLAEAMGYTPDPFLSGLAKYRHPGKATMARGTIAWLNHWRHPALLRGFKEFDNYFGAAKQAAERLGYQLEEVFWPADCTARTVEGKLLELGVLGLLIPPHPEDVSWKDFSWSRFSLIRFGLSVRQPDSNLVTADQHRAIIIGMRRIYELGYRRIGLVVNGLHDRTIGGNFTGGFQSAQRLLNLEPRIPPMDLEMQPPPEGPRRYKAALGGWMQKYQPDAILTEYGEVVSFLKELGYRVPQDVALAGTTVYDVPLEAGIDQRPRAIGRIAAEMLIKQITLKELGEPAEPCRILVESRWRDGASLPDRT
jgi:LacI family transcriptional regulator